MATAHISPHRFEIISLLGPACLLFSLESNKQECKLVNIDRTPTVSRVLCSMQWQTAIYSKRLAFVSVLISACEGEFKHSLKPGWCSLWHSENLLLMVTSDDLHSTKAIVANLATLESCEMNGLELEDPCWPHPVLPVYSCDALEWGSEHLPACSFI